MEGVPDSPSPEHEPPSHVHGLQEQQKHKGAAGLGWDGGGWSALGTGLSCEAVGPAVWGWDGQQLVGSGQVRLGGFRWEHRQGRLGAGSERREDSGFVGVDDIGLV